MRRSVTLIIALYVLAMGDSPASAADPPPGVVCQTKRTIAVGKSEKEHKKWARIACRSALRKKGEAQYGSKFWGSTDYAVECQELGVPGGSEDEDYWQCICSAHLCWWTSFGNYVPPGGFRADRTPQFERAPHGSFGTRRAVPPSFRPPSIRPKIR